MVGMSNTQVIEGRYLLSRLPVGPLARCKSSSFVFAPQRVEGSCIEKKDLAEVQKISKISREERLLSW